MKHNHKIRGVRANREPRASSLPGAGVCPSNGSEASSTCCIKANAAKHAVPQVLIKTALFGLALGTATAAVHTVASSKTKEKSQELPAPGAPQIGKTLAPVLKTILVTGSMIPRTESESAQAVTVIHASTLKSLGVTNVEQALALVSSNTPNVNVAQSVGLGTGGGSYADLRGLGNGRTLVLLDGHRLASNAYTGDAVDLSGIPFSAISSIQVLREGASALYGSDAIAGVINFITKRDYQGFAASATLDVPQQSGGGSGNASVTFGHGDLVRNGYNFMITASFNRQQELRATQRSFSAAGFYPALGDSATNNPGTWPGTIVDANGNSWQPGYPACAGNPYLTTYLGNCAYRYSAATDLLPNSYDASALIAFTKELPKNNVLSIQYFYTRSRIAPWLGPMFYYFEMTPQADPNYFPTSAAGLTCEGGCSAPPDLTQPIYATWTDPTNNRYAALINSEQRTLVSISGDNYGWNYKFTLNFSQNLNTDGVTGGFPNFSVLAPNGILSNLVNPFGAQSPSGQAFINSTYINGVWRNGRMRRWSVSGHARHRLGDAFHAGHDAILALGFSVSGDQFETATTPFNIIAGPAIGGANFAVKGSRTAQALYAELYVPISKALSIDISDREDRYSDFGRTNNGKIALRYQPSKFVTFRGTASTGFRAPSLYDLYNPNTVEAAGTGSIGSGNPLCTPGNYSSIYTPAICATQGLGLYGGNPKLTPETSENFDLGVILAPLNNLGITIDYYRILLKNTIGSIPAAAIYSNPTLFSNDIVLNNQGTFTPSVASSTYCQPFTAPTCGYIILTNQNTGGITTDGLDISIKYRQHTKYGEFEEDLEGTAVTQFRLQEYAGGPVLNLVGWYNQGNPPAMRWQHFAQINWRSPGGTWGAGISNRFYSSYIDEFGLGASNDGPQRTVGSQSTWDVYSSYTPFAGLTAVLGVRNLFNTNPPFTNAVQNNYAAGYSSQYSNPILRDFYLHLTYKFK